MLYLFSKENIPVSLTAEPYETSTSRANESNEFVINNCFHLYKCFPFHVHKH